MVQANIDNDPISVTINSNESVTVPSGEVWKANITLATSHSDFSSISFVSINGVSVMDSKFEDDDGTGGGSPSHECVLVGGDTVEYSGGEGAHISGFVVN